MADGNRDRAAEEKAQAAIDRLAESIERKDARSALERWAWSIVSVATLIGGFVSAHLIEGNMTPEVERIGTIGAVIVVVMIFVREMRADRESRHKAYGAATTVVAANTQILGRTLQALDHHVTVGEKLVQALDRFLDFEEAIQDGRIKRQRRPPVAPVETAVCPPPGGAT